MIRFGLIGCGRIAERHIETMGKVPQVTLVAVSDVAEERMQAAQRHYQQVRKESEPLRRYTNYHDLLHDPQIDAVAITSSSGLHASMCKAALLAGKHVMLEKPMALSLTEAEEIVNLAEQHNRTLLVCHQLRYRPIVQKMKQLIDQKALGTLHLGVVTLRMHRSPQYYEAAPWRGLWSESGGMLLNQGIHMIDLLQWFMGDVQQVYGTISRGPLPKETEDIALGILSFTNQAKGVIEANTLTCFSNLETGIAIFGERGTIAIGGPSFNQVVRWAVEGQSFQAEQAAELLADTAEHQYMYEDFCAAVSSGKNRVLVNGQEGKRTLETIFALYQSAHSQRAVGKPSPTFTTAMLKEMG